MILKTYPNRNLYGKYFLATEAPDDEEVTEEQPKPRRNVKVITVKPSNRGKDFTVAGDPPIDPETVETNGEIDSDDFDYDIPDEATAEDTTPAENPEAAPTEATPAVTDQGEQPAEPETTTDTEVDAPDMDDDTTDYSQDDTGDQTVNDATATTDAPDTGGEDDFTADTGDASTDTTASTDGTTDTTPSKPNAPGVELDSTRKYNLYKEFMSLYNACDNYISKLENILRNDSEENQIIRISVNNLREIKDIISDYMTIRFQLNTYVQSLLFYQKMVVAVQLVFRLLKSIHNKKESNNKKKK